MPLATPLLDVKVLRDIQVTRVSDASSPDGSFMSETVLFESQLPIWLMVTKVVDIPENFKTELMKKYEIHHLLPMRIAG